MNCILLIGIIGLINNSYNCNHPNCIVKNKHRISLRKNSFELNGIQSEEWGCT